jgi:hypothetical protein
LKQSSLKNVNGTFYWPSIINISTSFFKNQQQFIAGVVSGNSSDPSSYAATTSTTTNGRANQQVQFVERSIGLDFVPVLLFVKNDENSFDDCSWIVCVGYNSDSFLIADSNNNNAEIMDAPKWVSKSSIYEKWSCKNAGKVYYQLAVAVKNIRV